MALMTTMRALRQCALATRRSPSLTRSIARASLLRGFSTAPSDVNTLPTHIKFRMPDLDFEHISNSSTEVTLVKWLVSEGQKVADGTHICEVETPDLFMTLQTGDEGYIAKLLVPNNQPNIQPGRVLAVFVPKEEDIKPFLSALESSPDALEGYAASPTVATANEPAAAPLAGAASTDSDDAATILRVLHRLQKAGRFESEETLKVLMSLARKNDEQLLVTYKGSFPNGSMREEDFDEAFFVDNATELAKEALAKDQRTT